MVDFNFNINVQDTAGPSLALLPSLDPADYTFAFDGDTFGNGSGLSLGSAESSSLYANCTIENTTGSGLQINDCSNVTFYNCTFTNCTNKGIFFSTGSSSSNVTIWGCTIDGCGHDGIQVPQRSATGVNHSNCILYDNTVNDTGSGGTQYHGIYTQSTGILIWNNNITGTVGGNGISHRSDGWIYGNTVNMTSLRTGYESAIKYYSDHKTGPTKALTIEKNTITGVSLFSAIELLQSLNNKPPATAKEDWEVNDFFILNNAITIAGMDGGVAEADYILVDTVLEGETYTTITESGNTYI